MLDDTSTPWYLPGAGHPPRRVHVRAQIGDKTLTAVRATDPRTGDDVWLEVCGHGSTARYHRLSAPADRWQPLNADRWQADLPRAIFTGAMHAEKMRFALVDEAEASDLAAEMERERVLSRAGRLQEASGERERYRREVLWWRDQTRVTYEPRGSVTPRMAEGRAMRALICDRAIRMGFKPWRSNAAVLAAIKETRSELEGVAVHDWMPPVQPLPPDWRDYEEVMGWLVDARISRSDQTILIRRCQSPPWSWQEIADALRWKLRPTRARFDEMIADIVKAANRRSRPAQVAIEELRKRNRSAKR